MDIYPNLLHIQYWVWVFTSAERMEIKQILIPSTSYLVGDYVHFTKHYCLKKQHLRIEPGPENH